MSKDLKVNWLDGGKEMFKQASGSVDLPFGSGKSYTSVSRELSFFDVVAAMRSGAPVVIRGEFLNGKECIINGVSREDGSGRKWIVTVVAVSDGPVGIYWDESKPCPFIAG